MLEAVQDSQVRQPGWDASNPERDFQFPPALGTPYAACKQGNQAMTKSMEVITEAVKNPKYTFPKVDQQPKKPNKHRYERRKIKEYLHIGEWSPGEAAMS
jgi:hypothetical protein